MQPPEFVTVACDAAGPTAVLTVCGEVDISNASVLSRSIDAALEAGCTAVLLEMSAVNFIDSTGLTVLIRGYKRARDHHGCLTIGAASPAVTRLLSVTGQLERFTARP